MLRFLEQQLPGVPVRLCLLITILLHLGCAWFSVGYYNPDEHFQILEFANYKLGLSPASDLAWEFPAKIRPAVQPAIAYAVYRALEKVHLADPFSTTFVLRLLMSVSAWLVTLFMCVIGLRWLSRDFSKIVLFLFSWFFWFFTYYHCRFSSENSAGIAFFAGLALILWAPLSAGAAAESRVVRNVRFFIAGILFAFSFFFRFQMGFAIFGIGLWLVIFRKASIGEVFCLFTAFCAGCLANICIDRWFYGTWVLTPVNYYVVNIVKGVSNEFGVSPWWYFIGKLLLNLAPPYSLVLLGAVCLSWYKCPKNPLVWISVPFFLLHCAVSHKEFRFLFPLMYAFPALLVLGVDAMRPSFIERLHRISLNKIVKAGIVLFIAFDAFLLLGYSFKPGKETIKIYKWIYKKGTQKPFSLITVGRSPYRLGDFPINFYRPKDLRVIQTQSADSLKCMIKESKEPATVLTSSFVIQDCFRGDSTEWKVVCRSLPQWIEHFNFNRWLSRVHVWTIYSVKNLE